jgi:hypothetical protein
MLRSTCWSGAKKAHKRVEQRPDKCKRASWMDAKLQVQTDDVSYLYIRAVMYHDRLPTRNKLEKRFDDAELELEPVQLFGL